VPFLVHFHHTGSYRGFVKVELDIRMVSQ